jgi:hypothetical protein
LSELVWLKSSFSDAGGNNCVEVAVADDDDIAIRDSVYPTRIIKTSKAALSTFIAGVRTGAGGATCPE